MNNLVKNIGIWLIIGLVVLTVVKQFDSRQTSRDSIPYSEFKTLIKNGQIDEVTIGDQVIRGTQKQEPHQFTVTRVEDPKLTEELEANGVKYEGLVANRWIDDLLSWIIPAIFFIAIWGFFFRRMSGAEGGVMSFAKSRAKIYADDEVKVRFSDVAGVTRPRTSSRRSSSS